MEYKVGDLVIINTKEHFSYNSCKYYRERKSLKKYIGKIIFINNIFSHKDYGVEVVNCPYKNECGRYKNTIIPYCTELGQNETKIPLEKLKLKKFIKHGV